MLTLPVIAVVLVGGAVYRAFRKPTHVGMTAERQKIYQAALVTLKEPAKLEALAQSFENEGCIAEARFLRQRAALRSLPKETKKARREVFARAINSSNADAIRKVASAFAGEGALGAAANLRRHADSLVQEAEMMKVFSEPAEIGAVEPGPPEPEDQETPPEHAGSVPDDVLDPDDERDE